MAFSNYAGTLRNERNICRLAESLYRRSVYLTIALALVLCKAGWGQATTGSIDGIVTDQSGAIVTNAAVSVTNENTGAVRDAVTDKSGLYTFQHLQPGRYKVAVTATGFAKIETELNVAVNDASRWDVALKPGNVASTVTVTDTAAQIDTETHQLAATIGTMQLENMPARSVFASVAYDTNVSTFPSVGTNNYNDIPYFGQQDNSLVIGGSSYGTTGFLQDGVSNFNYLTKTANYEPSVESTQEVSLIRNGASARFDSPNIVDVQTKSGTNSFHGRVYDFLRNDAMNAIGEIKTIKPPLRYNQFGANVGGPILRNRLFFFFDYAGLRNHSSSLGTALVPTDAERAGDFSALSTTIYDPDTYDPVTGSISAFPNNTIPSNRITDFATKFLAYLPLPNPTTVAGENYQRTLPSSTNYDSLLARIDYSLGKNDTIYGAYMKTNPLSKFATFAATSLYDSENLTYSTNSYIEETHVFNPNLVNLFRVGYNRGKIFVTLAGVGSQDFATLFGLTALSGTPLSQSFPPTVSFSEGYDGLGAPTLPQGALQNLYQYSDELTLVHGKHTIYFGMELDRLQFNGNWVIYNNGGFNFNGQYTSDHTNEQNGGNSIADFLLGYSYNAYAGIGSTLSAFREYNFMPYVQDDWRVSRRLTINLGLRYDYYESPSDKDGHSNIYDVTTNTNHPGTYRQTYDNLAPRVGFAYALNSNTSINAGYGIYYTIPQYNELQFLMANTPNFTVESNTFTAAEAVPLADEISANPSNSILAPFTSALRMPTAYVAERNLSIQHSFGKDLVANLSYLGSSAFHMMRRINPNQAYLPSDPSNPESLSSRRPYSWVGDVLETTNIGKANYNGFEASVRGTYGKDKSFFASYVFSKALDNVSSEAETPENAHDLGPEYGPATFNQKYVFKAGGEALLPIVGKAGTLFRTDNTLANQVLGGWDFSGALQVLAGMPFNTGASDLSNTGGYHAVRSNVTCNGNSVANRSLNNWFNTSCYSQPGVYEFGNERRDDLVGPRNTLIDLALLKTFPLAETRSVIFRVNALGALNHPLPSIPNADITATNAGVVTNFSGARILEVSLKFAF